MIDWKLALMLFFTSLGVYILFIQDSLVYFLAGLISSVIGLIFLVQSIQEPLKKEEIY